MKIIHISDLHFPRRSLITGFVSNIISKYKLVSPKPVIVISGDIFDEPASDNAYELAKSQFQKFINEGFILIIGAVGNHDCKRGGLTEDHDIDRHKGRYAAAFLPLLPTGRSYKDFSDRLSAFPMVHKIDDHFFIGLDSMMHMPDGAKGIIGEPQIAKLKHILSTIREQETEPIIIVYLHHSPTRVPFQLKLNDKDALLTAVKGVNVLLFGHRHRSKRFEDLKDDYNINCAIRTGNKQAWTEIDTTDYSSNMGRYTGRL